MRGLLSAASTPADCQCFVVPHVDDRNETASLGAALVRGDVAAVLRAVRGGADVTRECFCEPVPAGRKLPAINALCLAAALDSVHREVLRMPLVLQSGMDINHPASCGRRTLDFATFGPLAAYLERFGAKRGTQKVRIPRTVPPRLQHTRWLAEHEFQLSGGPLRSDQWQGCIDSRLLAALRTEDVAGAERLCRDAGTGGRAPLVHLAWPCRLLDVAMRNGAIEQVRHLLSLEGMAWPAVHPGMSDGRFRCRMSVATLATSLDSMDGCPMLLQLVLDAGIDLSEPDGDGHTCYQVATHPDIQRFLVEAGVDPWKPGPDGRIPFDWFDSPARSLAERRRFGTLVGTTAGDRVHRRL